MKHYANSPEPVHNAFCEDLILTDLSSYTEKNLEPPKGLERSLVKLYKSKPLVGSGGLVEISMLRNTIRYGT